MPKQSLLQKVIAPTVFVAETMTWGLQETFNFRKNWVVPQHDRQHGLDDGRSESFYIASGVSEAIFTGDALTAVGRFFALFPDVLHSVNLVRHSEGKDLMKGGNAVVPEIPDFVRESIGRDAIDAQSLRFKFTDGKSKLGQSSEILMDKYNRWLLLNRSFNFKMFPNGAGRMAEMTTGLGLLIVGSLVANKDGANTANFDVIRGYMEAAIGAGSLAAGVVDIFVTESDEDSNIEVQDHSDFIRVKKSSSETSLSSLLKAGPRYIHNSLARMHNDNKIIDQYAELVASNDQDKIEDFKADPILKELLQKAELRQKESSSLSRVFRSVAGSVIGDFKELGDHFSDVLKMMKTSSSPMAVMYQDLRSAPSRYAGAVQLATSQLLLPLAVYTSVAGAINSETTLGKVGFVIAGMAMSASWFFKHRGCAAKTKMSLRGTMVGGDNDNDAPRIG